MLKKKFEKLISDKFDIPLDGISDVPSAHFLGNTHLDIDGCVSIKKYETDEIQIRCKEHLLKIVGDSLSMLTFSEGRVSIRGNINTYGVENLGK